MLELVDWRGGALRGRQIDEAGKSDGPSRERTPFSENRKFVEDQRLLAIYEMVLGKWFMKFLPEISLAFRFDDGFYCWY
jgi:hypothetical protein